MPRSDPPLASAGDRPSVDSGWSSLPPAPTSAEAPSGSGLQRSPTSKRRAEGTLLGVAPPGAPAAAPPPRVNPVVVHAGLARTDSQPEALVAPAAPSAPTAPTAPEAALPVPTAPAPFERTKSAESPSSTAIDPPQPPPAQREPVSRAQHRYVVPDEQPRSRALDREPDLVLKPPVAPLATAPVKATKGRGALRTFVIGALFVLCVASAFVAGSRRVAPGRAVSAAPPPVVAASAAVTEASPPPALDIAAIEVKPPDARTAAEVVALAGVAAGKKRDAAARFTQELLQNPALLQKKGTFAELRKLVADPLTAQPTLTALAGLPGPTGPDVLYELWSSTPNKTDATELARALLAAQDVHRRASDALVVTQQLRAMSSCGDVALLIERARQVGDKRALGPLTKWKRKPVCAAAGQKDCCTADEAKDIGEAMSAVKSRNAPFDGT